MLLRLLAMLLLLLLLVRGAPSHQRQPISSYLTLQSLQSSGFTHIRRGRRHSPTWCLLQEWEELLLLLWWWQ
jgi:hypothetical protein